MVRSGDLPEIDPSSLDCDVVYTVGADMLHACRGHARAAPSPTATPCGGPSRSSEQLDVLTVG